MWKKWWVWTASHVVRRLGTWRKRTGNWWWGRGSLIGRVSGRGSDAQSVLQYWRQGHWPCTASPTMVLAGDHSGIITLHRRNPGSTWYHFQIFWGLWGFQSKSEGGGRRYAPTSGFTSCTAMCGTQYWLWRKLTVPTPASHTVTCLCPGRRTTDAAPPLPSSQGGWN